MSPWRDDQCVPFAACLDVGTQFAGRPSWMPVIGSSTTLQPIASRSCAETPGSASRGGSAFASAFASIFASI
jgi:hypothetical protein